MIKYSIFIQGGESMKKIIVFLLIASALSVGLVGCGGNENSSSTSSSITSTSGESKTENTEPLTESEIKQMNASPKKFVGRNVELTGRIFTTPEESEGSVAFQMFTDPQKGDGNTVVLYMGENIDLKSDDYVKISGKVVGEFEGTNAFGGTITAPQILAETVELSSYADIIDPAIQTVTLENPTQDQYGYSVTIDKVEFAKDETRVYVTVNNNGSSNFSLYSFNAKCVQNGKQLEEQSNYTADYPRINSDLLPGATTSGIIAFPAMDIASFKLVLEAYSNDYTTRIQPYTFEITV